MAATWDKIQRSVILRANQLQADSAADLATSYDNPLIGQTEMGDRAIEFPATAVNDAILDACDRLINIIANDTGSPYRNYFSDVTGNIVSGSTIPTLSATSKLRVGQIGEVRDSRTFKKLVPRAYQDVIGVLNMSLKQIPFWYYTDNTRIWHTQINVIVDVVVWDKATQLAAMVADPRGDCPFPEDLHEAIVTGALAHLFRGDFNIEQAPLYQKLFEERLAELSPKQ